MEQILCQVERKQTKLRFFMLCALICNCYIFLPLLLDLLGRISLKDKSVGV